MAAILASGVLTLAAACESKVSQENYDKIQTGMALGDVERLLGKGDEQLNEGVSIGSGGLTGGAARNSQKTYTWHEPKKEISVTFNDENKVVSKNQRGL